MRLCASIDVPVETIYSSPTVAGGRVFIGDRGGYVHAVDARTGRPLWSTLTSRARNNDVNGTAVVIGNQVVVSTNAARVVSLEAASGRMLWSQPIDGSAIHEVTRVPSGLLVASHSSLYWLDAGTGEIQQRMLFRSRSILSFATRGRRVVAILGSPRRPPGFRELVGVRDGEMLYRRRDAASEWHVAWLPVGCLVETRRRAAVCTS